MFAKHVLSNLDFDESQELDESLDMRKAVCPGAGPRQYGGAANTTQCDSIAMRNIIFILLGRPVRSTLNIN